MKQNKHILAYPEHANVSSTFLSLRHCFKLGILHCCGNYGNLILQKIHFTTFLFDLIVHKPIAIQG